MTSSGAILDLGVDLSREEALRYLGYPEGRDASRRAAERMEALWRDAVALLVPRGAMELVDRGKAVAAGMPSATEPTAVAVCTIGPALEEESARLAAAGVLLDALVLDAIGSAAAEAAADALNLEVCTLAVERGFEAAPRVSPGYGDWSTACQAALLSLLPIGALGLSLTTGSMMVPRKSVSFAIELEPPGRGVRHAASRCANCGLENCRHRIAPADCG